MADTAQAEAAPVPEPESSDSNKRKADDENTEAVPEAKRQDTEPAAAESAPGT